jgi:hypothetical protein
VPFKPSNNLSLISDPVLVNDQGVHEGAKFQQRVPVAAVACQPRRLDRQHSAGRAGADCRKQTLEAGAALTAARSAKIIINDNDVLPAERARSFHQRILSPPALGVVEQLIHR